MQTAENVAKWFLAENERKMGSERTTKAKLHILLYYAQGIHLAAHGERLFPDPIIAHKDDAAQFPVEIDSIADLYKDDFDSIYIGLCAPPVENFSDEEKDTLEFVMEEFSQFTTWRLREIICGEDPWQTASPAKAIDVEVMRKYFEEEYVIDEDEEEA